MTKRTDLTHEQKDYAVFLPAISSFYATFIGKQRSEEYIPQARMPAKIPEMEMLNFLNDQDGIFKYKWALYSAGHANLDLTKEVPKEDMIRKRDPKTTLLADSGGFQIAKGVWEADWLNPNCPIAEKYRSTVLKWLCNISDYSMTLDIPTWACNNPEVAKKINIHTYEDAVTATKYNHEYFMKHSTNDAKFLNVLQGSNHTDADRWYEEMKEFSDPTKHEKYFRGWAMGGANMADPHLALKRIVKIIDDGLLEEGKQDWMHFLGTSKLEWAVLLTSIQRAVRKYHNPNFTISFDCASPFLATANGRAYSHVVYKANGKWAYQMAFTVDDKRFANDTRSFRDVVTTETSHKHEGIIHPVFEDSPISERLQIKDICHYAPGDLNKIGKEGATSWDSFSYALLMAHNVWHHINAVQEANRLFDSGEIPGMLYDPILNLNVDEIVNAIFATPDYNERIEIIDSFSKFWMGIAGARGMGGKKAVNASAQFDSMFDLDVDKAIAEEEKRLNVTAKVSEEAASLFEGL